MYFSSFYSLKVAIKFSQALDGFYVYDEIIDFFSRQALLTMRSLKMSNILHVAVVALFRHNWAVWPHPSLRTLIHSFRRASHGWWPGVE